MITVTFDITVQQQKRQQQEEEEERAAFNYVLKIFLFSSSRSLSKEREAM
jgi:hypothetical protein